MKKPLLLILLVISINCFAQKDTSAPKLTDTTKIFSLSDLVRLSERYKDESTYNQFQSFVLILNKVIADRVKEWEAQNKK